jgi:Cys-tRNA(Pro)/Cys-tRNA(Cys) deacylase
MTRAEKKTNACRLLDAAGVAYRLVGYEVDESDLSAVAVARKVGMPLEQVYKTLCLRADDGTIVLAVVAGDQQLDRKALARAAGKRSCEPVAVRELLGLTGYVRGGVTALGCKKPYPAFVDELCLLHDQISVSAGQRGLQIWLAPADFLRVAAASVVDIGRPAAD